MIDEDGGGIDDEGGCTVELRDTTTLDDDVMRTDDDELDTPGLDAAQPYSGLMRPPPRHVQYVR